MKKYFIALLLSLSSFAAMAWEPTPGKPVTIIIGYNPGSANELLTRKITSIINKTNNVNFIVCFTPLLSIPRENDSIIPLILLSNVNTFSNPCSENESIRLDRPFDKDIKVFPMKQQGLIIMSG